MKDADFRVMAALEEGIAIDAEPFRALAARAGLSQDEFLQVTNRLLASGAVRRLAVVFDSRALGFATTLVAAKLQAGKASEAAAVVNSFDEVTHNYRRDGSAFEMWFTLTAATRGRIDEILAALSESGLFDALVELPAERVFKARVCFGGGPERAPVVRKQSVEHLTDLEKKVIGAVEEGLAAVRRPYLEAARKAGCDEREVLETLRSLAARGVVKRVSGILRPGAVGLSGAALVAWRVERERLEEIGRALAKKPFITHCVSRKSAPGWPYNLYTMMHGEDAARVGAAAVEIAASRQIREYVVMETLEEFKKTPAKYSFESRRRGSG